LRTTELLRDHGPTVALGFMFAFLSSFGQTYFIALSVPEIQATFGLSHGTLGAIFSSATLVSGFLLIWLGSTLDRVSVRLYGTATLAGLAVAALALSFAGNVGFVAAAIFALRLFGQGMLSHAAVTSTARLPAGVRGRAIGFASLGFQAGTAVFPASGVALILWIGWRATWQVAAGALAVCAIALFVMRVRDEQRNAPTAATEPGEHRRRDLLRDWRFLVLVPAMMGPAAVSTGFFFHQRLIASEQGWSLELLATGIAVSALASVLSAIATGALVDRAGAIRVTRFYLVPLATASLLLGLGVGPLIALPFFALMGITSGASGVAVTATLAELYGTEQLGMIRALAAAIMVIASALTPAAMGFAFDARLGLFPVALLSAAYLGAASLVLLWLPARPPR
jgi:predicted MFS family arabinose efflux permease